MATRGNAALKPADIRRQFWAEFLGSKVCSDGQVPGFSRWADQVSRFALQLAEARAARCASQVERGADAESCIANAVSDLKHELQLFVPPQEGPRPDANEVRELVRHLAATLGWNERGLRPFVGFRVVADETVFEPRSEETADARG